jgi:hypothetical protein
MWVGVTIDCQKGKGVVVWWGGVTELTGRTMKGLLGLLK